MKLRLYRLAGLMPVVALAAALHGSPVVAQTTDPAQAWPLVFAVRQEAAAAEVVPASVSLKDPKDFRLIGKHAPRKDSFAKTNGSAQFTQDVHLPGMLVAMVAYPPRFGGVPRSVDSSKARAVATSTARSNFGAA